VVCGAHLFVLSIDVQAGLELAEVAKNGAKFSQCNIVWGGFLRAREDVESLSLVDDFFLLD
jgi:hypothetical protein